MSDERNNEGTECRACGSPSSVSGELSQIYPAERAGTPIGPYCLACLRKVQVFSYLDPKLDEAIKSGSRMTMDKLSNDFSYPVEEYATFWEDDETPGLRAEGGAVRIAGRAAYLVAYAAQRCGGVLRDKDALSNQLKKTLDMVKSLRSQEAKLKAELQKYREIAAEQTLSAQRAENSVKNLQNTQDKLLERIQELEQNGPEFEPDIAEGIAGDEHAQTAENAKALQQYNSGYNDGVRSVWSKLMVQEIEVKVVRIKGGGGPKSYGLFSGNYPADVTMHSVLNEGRKVTILQRISISLGKLLLSDSSVKVKYDRDMIERKR